ncbi:hypothetical protein HPB51_025337 [Rhipicephalus microplus]|uniref:Wd40 domain protein n=1 Tax=Rhipicephalus microplus TaxID=6941 RepID=A0A9J6DDL8_RHIMP|nr:hypothetical protein HPB51_025337 [Rhipicephalus microplus]
MVKITGALHHEEFVAHGSTVKCLAIGHKSGRVMVTGGEDNKVNLWAIGKTNCIMLPKEFRRFGRRRHSLTRITCGPILCDQSLQERDHGGHRADLISAYRSRDYAKQSSEHVEEPAPFDTGAGEPTWHLEAHHLSYSEAVYLYSDGLRAQATAAN